MANDLWKTLLRNAIRIINDLSIDITLCEFGGGSSLTAQYDHRLSRDVDIFLPDPQLISYVTPRFNDTIEKNVKTYQTTWNSCQIILNDGSRIDFVYSTQVSKYRPVSFVFDDIEIMIESPVEVIAKKIYYRADAFAARDIFDLAFVYTVERKKILDDAESFVHKIDELEKRLDIFGKCGELMKSLKAVEIFPAGEIVRHREFDICRQFIADIRTKRGAVVQSQG
jgi:hypothetical protein